MFKMRFSSCSGTGDKCIRVTILLLRGTEGEPL
jgi:hypothetical protein